MDQFLVLTPLHCFQLWLWRNAEDLTQQRIWGCQTSGPKDAACSFSRTKLPDPSDPNQWNSVALGPGLADGAHSSGGPRSKKYQIPKYLNILSQAPRAHKLLKIIKLKLILDCILFSSFILLSSL